MKEINTRGKERKKNERKGESLEKKVSRCSSHPSNDLTPTYLFSKRKKGDYGRVRKVGTERKGEQKRKVRKGELKRNWSKTESNRGLVSCGRWKRERGKVERRERERKGRKDFCATRGPKRRTGERMGREGKRVGGERGAEER